MYTKLKKKTKAAMVHSKSGLSELRKDTEALICDLEVPEVDAKVIGRHERLLVAVHRY